MNVMRNLLKSRSGFTLVELMVVVVVLGILAGIAVQRMGDVRDRAETAAQDANRRLLLGAANLAKTRNYGTYMFVNTAGTDYRNGVIRWMRPCSEEAVTQLISQYAGNMYTGYGNIDPFIPSGWDWTGQEWNLTTYFESFPVGYAVEIIFARADGGTAAAAPRGYSDDVADYEVDQILIFRYVGDIADDSTAWETWYGSMVPGGTGGPHDSDRGINYPYHDATQPPNRDNWEQIFPETS